MKSWLLIVILILGLFPMMWSGLLSNGLTQANRDTTFTLFNVTAMNGLDPKYYSFEALSYIPPNVTPITIIVAKNLEFNNTAWKPYYLKVKIPDQSYSFILMNVSVKEENGTQYDRPLYVFVNGIPVFWGSTQEILNSSASVDLTEFENLLKGNVTFEPVLVNFYDAKVNITGVYLVNITLSLYPGNEPSGLPNVFIPLFVNGSFDYNYSYVILNPQVDSFTSHVNLPNGTYRVLAQIFEEGGGLDEFWYANEPATRDILLYYNGLLASVIPPYETVYTGGIDLFWWKPMPSINTLVFHTPYQADLTPFLALGDRANLTVSVSNLNTALQINHSPSFDWDLSGFLMLWVNKSDPLLSGNLTMAYSRFLDSSPIFEAGFSGVHYQEGGSYLLKYSSTLQYQNGEVTSTVVQEGNFYSSQSFNNIYEFAYLDEKFNELAIESGLYSSYLDLSGNFPVTLQISSFSSPITPTDVIPYNLSYSQNGSINLGVRYTYVSSFNGHILNQSLNETLTSVGGFSGIIEVINSYGGAVLVKLTSNNALTQKQLNFSYQTSGQPGFEERFLATSGQNSSVNLTGYYLKIERIFTVLPPLTSSASTGTHQLVYRQGTQVEFPHHLRYLPQRPHSSPSWIDNSFYFFLQFECTLSLTR
ncbi:MAG: peptide-N4-asparagine amidase, partial [Metallosphaera sp.]